jgi:methionine-rich copper-binding protein CopC
VNLAAIGRFDAFTTQQMRRIFMSMRRLRAGLSGLAMIMRRSSFFAGLILLLLLSPTGSARAHAFLDHAEPRVGNKVAAAPRQVTLWFTQKPEPAFSTISVTNSAGERVDTGKTRVSGEQMSISLRSGGAGTYHVTWRVLSVDTHTTDGNFTFQVGP